MQTAKTGASVHQNVKPAIPAKLNIPQQNVKTFTPVNKNNTQHSVQSIQGTNKSPDSNPPKANPTAPKAKPATTNANGSSSKSKSVNSSTPTTQKLTPPIKRMGRRSQDIENYNKSAKPFIAKSKAFLAGAAVNPNKRNKNRISVIKTEDKKKNKITFSNQDVIKVYIPHEASYRISSENIFNVMTGLNIFDYADALWLEVAPATEASLPFSLFEFDVYDDSEQRIIICTPEFKNIDELNDQTNPVLDGSPEQTNKKENQFYEEIPFEFNCTTVVGKPVCKITYYSEVNNHIKTKCLQSAVRIMHLDISLRDRQIGTVVQENNVIVVKDKTNRTVMEVADVPITIGGFCIHRDKAFKCEVRIFQDKSKRIFGIMGRNGKRKRKGAYGPALGFYFCVTDNPMSIAALSFYKMYVLAILVGLSTLYTEMG